jgi:hypothetical protein
MVAADITLTNPNVNLGNPVTIPGVSFSYGWKNISRAKPSEGAYDITESHYGGFENPKITVQGFFDADSTETNVITHALLIDFLAVKGGTTTLKISLGETPLVLGGRPDAGYSTSGGNTLDTINGIDVQIESLDITGNVADAEFGQKVNFTLVFHETK